MHSLALLLLIASAPGMIERTGTAPATAERQWAGLWIDDTQFLPADIAHAEQAFDGETGVPYVMITFTESGQAKFVQLQQRRTDSQLAIRVDGEIVASPWLMETISGNELAIEGQFTVEEAKALARRIAPPRR